MTNKEKYINSFSEIELSDEVKERILNMKTPNKRVSLRAFAIAFAVLIMLAVAMLTANAATDGELTQRIADTAVVKNFKVVLGNGVEMNPEDYELTEKQITDENGNTQNILEFSLNGESGDDSDDEIIISFVEDVEREIDNFEVKVSNGEEVYKYYLED